MADHDDFTIAKLPVYGRDTRDVNKILGWTWAEMALMGCAVVFAQKFFGSRLITLGTAALVYLWVRKIKSFLPERIVQKLVRHHLRPHTTYRAAGRDTAWRPPVIDP